MVPSVTAVPGGLASSDLCEHCTWYTDRHAVKTPIHINIFGGSVVALAFNPALWRQKQMDLCECEASLVYRATSMTTRIVTQRNLVFFYK